RITRTDPVVAQRQVGLAQGLERRGAAREALGRGSISTEHAAVIVQADRNLPRQVTAVQRDRVEADLLAKAETLSPTALRRAARRALEAVENDVAAVDAHENELVVSEEDRARAKTRLTMHDNGDGTVTGHFTVPSAQGSLLKKIIETITAPRRGRLGASQAQVGEREARTDFDRARGEALVELIEHLPTDHLHPRSAATLVVTVSEEILRGALKAVGLDTGEILSAGEVRRLACNAHLIPAVLGGKSLPLDLGRGSRLFTEAQRIALGLRHSTCAADGCDRPFAWCELHHLHSWALGGRTDLANAVPLCHFHHQRIHDHRYRHTRAPDGSIRFRLVT
ncbi:HNH endonuclease signature motif containing protein, partial [Nocardioides marmorisolisilvae]